MLNREEIIRDIENNKIIVIMRGFTEEQLVNSVEAMEKGGIRLVEVTFDQSGKVSDETTASYIKALRDMKEYFAAGAKGIGIATAIADKKAIGMGDYEEITRRARLFTDQL